MNQLRSWSFFNRHSLSAGICLLLTGILTQGVQATFLQTANVQQDAAATDSAADEKAAQPQKRRKVIVSKAGAQLRTPQKVVWNAYLGETYDINLQKDDWLWVQEKGGWIWEKETLPFESAIEDTTNAIKAAPTAQNYHLRGVAHLAHGNYDKAIADFDESLKRGPGIAGVLNNRGKAWYEKGDFQKARADFSAAIKASAKHFVAYNNRALCAIAEEDYDSALKDLDTAIGMNKEYTEALNNRGVVHSRQGRFRKAIDDFSAAIKIYDRFIDALGNRAYAYRQSGDIKKAIADLELAMSKDKMAYQPVNDLAWIYATAKSKKVRNGEKAVELATKACEMTQYTDWNALDTLAAAYAAKGDFEQAAEWVGTAIENAPEEQKAGLVEHREQILARKPLIID